MSLYVDSDSRLHHDQASGFALACPHCQVLSHITPVSVPAFAQLASVRPTHVGIVYRCDARSEAPSPSLHNGNGSTGSARCVAADLKPL